MPTHRKYDNQAQRQAAYRARRAAAHNEQMASGGLPSLRQMPTLPGHRRFRALTRTALEMLKITWSEMQDYYEERSEAWQCSERAETFIEHIDALEEIIDLLSSLGITAPTTKENTNAH